MQKNIYFRQAQVKNSEEFHSQYRSVVRNRETFYSILCRSHLIKVKGPQSHARSFAQRKYRVYKRGADCIVTEQPLQRVENSQSKAIVPGYRDLMFTCSRHSTPGGKLKTATAISLVNKRGNHATPLTQKQACKDIDSHVAMVKKCQNQRCDWILPFYSVYEIATNHFRHF